MATNNLSSGPMLMYFPPKDDLYIRQGKIRVDKEEIQGNH